MNKTTAKNSEARTRIIDTAIRLFFKQGYLATGVNQIIKEANICKTTFYYNFTSKEDLCLEYIKTSHENWLSQLHSLVDKSDDPYAKVLALFEFAEQWMVQCEFRGCGLINIASEIPDMQTKIRQLVNERNDILRENITALLNNLKENDSRYAHIDVPSLSDILFVLLEGLIVSSQNYGKCWPIHAAKNYFIEIAKLNVT